MFLAALRGGPRLLTRTPILSQHTVVRSQPHYKELWRLGHKSRRIGAINAIDVPCDELGVGRSRVGQQRCTAFESEQFNRLQVTFPRSHAFKRRLSGPVG